MLNKFNDVWFQDIDLTQNFGNEIREYYKYFEGPRVLTNIDFMLSAQSN